MNRFSLSQMARLPRLADLIMPSHREFYPDKLITDVGLYEAVLIDAADIQIIDQMIGEEPPHFEVSRDVVALHAFMNLKDRIMLPCPDCRQNQPFDLKASINPRRVTTGTPKPSKTSTRIPVTDVYASVETGSTCHNIFDPPDVPKYRIGQDYLDVFDQSQFQEVDFADYMRRCALACVDGIAEQVDEIMVLMTPELCRTI